MGFIYLIFHYGNKESELLTLSVLSQLGNVGQRLKKKQEKKTPQQPDLVSFEANQLSLYDEKL